MTTHTGSELGDPVAGRLVLRHLPPLPRTRGQPCSPWEEDEEGRGQVNRAVLRGTREDIRAKA